jgi:hypothetical protein
MKKATTTKFTTRRATKTRTGSKARRKPWTPADTKALHRMAGKSTARFIAANLGRTQGAVRQKAHAMNLSLETRGRKSA